MLKWLKKKIGIEDDRTVDKAVIRENFDEANEVESSQDLDKNCDEEQVQSENTEDISSFKVDNSDVIFSVEEETIEKNTFWKKIFSGLEKTRKDVIYKFEQVLGTYDEITDELFEDLEEVLITADIGMDTTMLLIDRLKYSVKENKATKPEEVKDLLRVEMRKLMLEKTMDYELKVEPSPSVILIVGVNGVGKTTTIGKLAHNLKSKGKSVLIAAGDTFRAAAIEQLEEWANRSNIDCISHSEGADPAAVIYDGIQAAKARKVDVLICDTAGRLHNKANLMNELNKIFRVLDKEYSGATREVLLVLDATTGQNAMIQAKTFAETTDLTGIVLTKLDGTAKGGVVLALQRELNIPVKLVGLGEGIDDLQEFIPEAFVDAIFN